MGTMRVDYTVIGAGVVGLAVAKRIAESMAHGEQLLVVEKEDTFGRGVSSRNSEVIHSGIYYPHGSLKHRLCIRGRKLMYEYCREHGVPHSKCGKLIVAVDESESEELEALHARAQKNGVENVTVMDAAEAKELEPAVNVHRALFSAETGIVDTHGLMKSMANDIRNLSGDMLYRSKVASIGFSGGEYGITLQDGTRFTAGTVVNAAGLGAVNVSEMIGISAEKMYPCKGSYFSYGGRHSCTHLIYPLPHGNLAGLGVHATIDLEGRLRFGPDIEYVSSVDDYTVDEKKKKAFYDAAKKLIKNLDYNGFYAESAGIRPKIQGPQENTVKDFYIREETGNGYPRFINLLGIESPGLTSSLAIGEYVHGMFFSRERR